MSRALLLCVAMSVVIGLGAQPAEARRRRRLLTSEEIYAAVAGSADVRDDGTVEFRIPAWLHWRGNGVVAFGYDRDFGEEKARFLDETFELRAGLGRRSRQRWARASVGELPWRARAIWCDASRNAAERRRLLYQLWADAAEPEDDELGRHGAAARAVLEQVVNAMLPAGSPDGYTLAELAALNRDRGRAPAFDPYAPGAGALPLFAEEAQHVDTLEDDPSPPTPQASEPVRAQVAAAMRRPPSLRRRLLFVVWDDAAQSDDLVGRAYVEQVLPAQRYSPAELARYAALRGDETFTHAASR